jgi:hypothetical protein
MVTIGGRPTNRCWARFGRVYDDVVCKENDEPPSSKCVIDMMSNPNLCCLSVSWRVYRSGSYWTMNSLFLWISLDVLDAAGRVSSHDVVDCGLVAQGVASPQGFDYGMSLPLEICPPLVSLSPSW